METLGRTVLSFAGQ